MTALAELGHLYVRSLTIGECPTGKLRFETFGSASYALELAELRAEREPNRRERRAFWCPACDGFHLTSQDAA